MCSKHVEAWNKLIIKFSESSWLILIDIYIEMHGQQYIKILIQIFPACDGDNIYTQIGRQYGILYFFFIIYK